MTRALQVHAEQGMVGTLREQDDLWAFDYAADWAARDDGFDLSPALPRARLQHRDGGTLRPVQWYFDNLLPEEQMRRLVAQDARLPHDDAFALLEYLGAESAGSLTLVPPGMRPATQAALRELTDAQLSARIAGLPRTSLARDAPKRMSLAGAQHKLLVVLKGRQLYEPVGATASTHILKPDHPDVQAYPGSTYLEALTMGLAGAAGLTVPAVHLLHVPKPVYVVERFDRQVPAQALRADTGAVPPTVRRLHVIDACQLLNRSRVFKHSAGIDALREAIERTGDVLTLPQRVFRWLVFNLLVGNDDAHLKNLSFMVQANTITLAPHYDLLATGVYHTAAMAGDQGRWPRVGMAVRLPGDVASFDAVTPASVLQAATTLGVPRPVAERVCRDVVRRTFKAFDRAWRSHFPDEAGLSPTDRLVDDAPASSMRATTPDDPEQALRRRILRILRYIVLPEMRARLPA